LLNVQQPNLNSWLIQRLAVIGLGMLLLLTLLTVGPLLMVNELSLGYEIVLLWTVFSFYLLLWMVIIFFIIRFGSSQADQALKMVGLWLLLTLVIPGTVNQYVLLNKPVDLMMDMIEANREGQSEIFDRPESIIINEAKQIMPELSKLDIAKNDSLLNQDMINGAYRLVLNAYITDISDKIIAEQKERNDLIKATYWFNPLTGFHNWLNNITKTGHEGNLAFREEIQNAGEVINRTLVMDEWGDRKMDRPSFTEYVQLFNLN